MSSGRTVDLNGKLELIEQISAATNQQTPVIAADRQSNENVFVTIQQVLFDRYGILYERKRGEFADGLHKRYVDQDDVLERNLFFRLFLASNGDIQRASEKKLFLRFDNPEEVTKDSKRLDNFYFGYLAYRSFMKQEKKSIEAQRRHFEVFGKVYALTMMHRPSETALFESVVQKQIKGFTKEWNQFMRSVEATGQKYVKKVTDKKTGQERIVFSKQRWLKSKSFAEDITRYFSAQSKISSTPIAVEDRSLNVEPTEPIVPVSSESGNGDGLNALPAQEPKTSWFSRVFLRKP